MEKRVLIAVFLSFLVLYAYQAIVPQPKRPVRRGPRRPRHRAGSVSRRDGSRRPTPATRPRRLTRAVAVPPTRPLVGDTAERDIVVDAGAVRATFSNRGAIVKSWQLMRYLDRRRQARSTSCRRGCRPRRRDRSRCASPTRPRRARSEQRAVSHERPPATSTRRRRRRRSPSSSTAATGCARRKCSASIRSPTSSRSRVEVSDGDATLNPAIEWGPGLGDSMHVEAQRSSFGTYVQKPQAIVYARRIGRAAAPAEDAWPASRRGRATSRLPASTTTTSSRASSDRARCASSTGPATAPMPGQPERSARHDARSRCCTRTPPVNQRVFVGPKDFDVLESVDRDLVRTHPLRHLLVPRGAAAALAEVDQRVRRQLRLVDHHPDHPRSTSRCSRSSTRASSRCGRCRSCSRR